MISFLISYKFLEKPKGVYIKDLFILTQVIKNLFFLKFDITIE